MANFNPSLLAALFTPSVLLARGASGIILFIVVVAFTTLLNSLVLWIAAKLFKLKNNTFKTALITAFVTWIASFVIGIILGYVHGAVKGTATSLLFSGLLNLILTFVVSVFAVKRFYKLETGKSFLVGLVWLVGQLIVGFVIAMVFAAILVAVLVGSKATGF